MRLLLDACIWGPAKEALEGQGHDVIWVGDWQEDPGDLVILGQAFEERRILLTLDKDFGELVVVRGRPHPGIIRLVGFSARQHAEIAQEILEGYEDELDSGALVTVEPHRVRIRPANRPLG